MTTSSAKMTTPATTGTTISVMVTAVSSPSAVWPSAPPTSGSAGEGEGEAGPVVGGNVAGGFSAFGSA